MKPRLGWLFLIGYAAVVLQSTLVSRLPLGPVRPDLILAVMVWLALWAPGYPALVAAWTLGLAKDVTSGGPMGAWAVLFLGAAAILAGLRDKFFTGKMPAQALLTAAAAFPVNLAYVVYRTATTPGTTPAWLAPLLALGGTLSTAAVAPGVVWALNRLRGPLGLKGAEGTA